MKTCPVCALELEDSYLFCPDDGSSLSATAGDRSSARLPGTKIEDDTTNVALHCPACGAEYPLTFSSCPVHGIPLTKQRTQSAGKQISNDSTEPPINAETIALAGPAIVALHNSTLSRHSNSSFGNDTAVNSTNSTGAENSEHPESAAESAAAVVSANGAQLTPAFSSQDRELDRPGFRIAAIATIIALAIFGGVGLYALVSNLSRHPSPATRSASQSEPAEAVPFVVTPQAALDYKEEQPAASASETATAPPAAPRIIERERKQRLSSSNEERDRTTPVARSVASSRSPSAPAPAAVMQASDPPVPVLHQANSNEFDSRLVRARSSRTPAGYRYDLTFNMQEQRGHAAQWQRVLITTRSASGTSHTQAIPFMHRLGATGALTFTISVELTGRSEADWRGRINCTTLGWDNSGAPLQASFAAAVTP